MISEHIVKIEQYMLVNTGDSAHDADHIYRVLNHALIIAKEYDVNEDVLVAACLLHDIGRPAQYADPRVCHAQIGSEMAYEFLKELAWNEDDCQHVKHCILTHRFRNDLRPETIEAKILYDADKLDVCGALGIARTLQYEGKMNYSLQEFLSEYDRKLIKLYDLFYTETGKQMAANGKKLLTMFYNELKDQLDQSEAQNWLISAKTPQRTASILDLAIL